MSAVSSSLIRRHRLSAADYHRMGETGVPELWVVDLDAGTVRRFRRPQGDQYLEAQASPSPGRVSIAALPEVAIDFDTLLAGVLDPPDR